MQLCFSFDEQFSGYCCSSKFYDLIRISLHFPLCFKIVWMVLVFFPSKLMFTYCSLLDLSFPVMILPWKQHGLSCSLTTMESTGMFRNLYRLTVCPLFRNLDCAIALAYIEIGAFPSLLIPLFLLRHLLLWSQGIVQKLLCLMRRAKTSGGKKRQKMIS